MLRLLTAHGPTAGRGGWRLSTPKASLRPATLRWQLPDYNDHLAQAPLATGVPIFRNGQPQRNRNGNFCSVLRYRLQ
jgi:hypothetical protein